MGIHTVQDAINAINAINAIDSAIHDIVDIIETHYNIFKINNDITAIGNTITAIDIINKGIDHGHSDVNIAIKNAITMNNKMARNATQILPSYSRGEEIKNMEETVSEIKENLRKSLRKNLEGNLRKFIEQNCDKVKTDRKSSKKLKKLKGIITSIQNNILTYPLPSHLADLMNNALSDIKNYIDENEKK